MRDTRQGQAFESRVSLTHTRLQAVSFIHCLCLCCGVPCPARRRPPGAFAGNELVTSKYNLINFIPVNLYHQFKRVANMYFAALVCLQVG